MGCMPWEGETTMNLIKSLVITLALASAVFAGAAQEVKTMKHKQVPMAKAQMYACPKCEMASMKGGKCAACGGQMVKINGTMVYQCPKCKATSAKAGNCPMCKVAMAPAVQTYACEACKVTATKAGSCPKCGAKLKKKTLKMAPMMKGRS